MHHAIRISPSLELIAERYSDRRPYRLTLNRFKGDVQETLTFKDPQEAEETARAIQTLLAFIRSHHVQS